MTYCRTVEVSNGMGNKTIYDENGTNITNTVVSDAIISGDSRVNIETGVTTWDVLDALYGSVQEAAECFAISYILRRYGKNENEINKESMDYYQIGLDICHSLASSATQSVYISSKAYKSFPINRTTGTIHRTLSGSDSTVNGE